MGKAEYTHENTIGQNYFSESSDDFTWSPGLGFSRTVNTLSSHQAPTMNYSL